MIFRSTHDTLAVDIGSHSIKAVQLKEKGDGKALERFGMKMLPAEAIVAGSIMDANVVVDTVRELVAENNIKTKNVVTAVSGHSVIIKKISVPKMTENELAESIHWESEQYIPFDIDDVNIDFQVIGRSGEEEDIGADDRMDVLLAAVKKEKIDDYTSIIVEAGMNPVVVDIDAFAIENCYEFNYGIDESKTVALIDIGAGVMNINIIRGDVTLFTRDISVGGNQYTEALQKQLKLDYQKSEMIKKGEDSGDISPDEVESVINVVSDSIAQEIQRSFDFFRVATSDENIDQIALTGGSCKIKGFSEYLSQRLGIETSVVDPFKNVFIDEKEFDIEYLRSVAPVAATGIGLALRRFGDR